MQDISRSYFTPDMEICSVWERGKKRQRMQGNWEKRAVEAHTPSMSTAGHGEAGERWQCAVLVLLCWGGAEKSAEMHGGKHIKHVSPPPFGNEGPFFLPGRSSETEKKSM